MKKLGFGCMRLPVRGKIPTMINVAETERLFDDFIKRGFTYFDTAYMYHGLRSEAVVRKALVERHERSTFTLADKLPLMPMFIRTEEQQRTIFDKQLQKCGVEYFDYYLLHSLNASSYEVAKKLKSFEFVQQKKAEGKIKHVGFSFHDKAELLDTILTEHPEVEFVQLQINYLDWDSDKIQSGKCYAVAVKHNKPVVVMEPVKGGTLATVPDEVAKLFKSLRPDASPASWAIRFAASLPNVMTVLSGMSSRAQLDDNTAYMADFEPLSQEEQAAVARAAEIIRGVTKIPCTACAYCVAGCPKNIPIPDYFALYNSAGDADKKKEAANKFKALAKHKGKPSDCINCKQCERSCPQHLPIVDYLKEVDKTFSK